MYTYEEYEKLKLKTRTQNFNASYYTRQGSLSHVIDDLNGMKISAFKYSLGY